MAAHLPASALRVQAVIGERFEIVTFDASTRTAADADFVRDATAFAIGGVPPVGHKTQPFVLIDETLARFAEIWAAAGAANTVFKLTFDDLVALTGGKVAQGA
jgi:prolyl-tRNA editing enzyme YbaK/EbsC (Cys-tRNA(Pro) deacylase)